MTNVEFIYETQSYKIQCNSEERMKDIFQKFATKLGVDLNSLYFLYGGKVINEELILPQIIGSIPKDTIKILVLNSKDEYNINNTNESIIRPKLIMCPTCHENIIYVFNNYKINLFGCRNGHKINNILLNEFINNQKYDMTKIKCHQCKANNKKETAFNEFYKCISCEMLLCPLYKTIHDKTHNIINIDKNYICSIHNEPYFKYCHDCRINSCIQCSNFHKNHKNIYLGDIIPNLDEIKIKMKELRNSIDTFKDNINTIIKKLNNVADNFEIYYQLNEFIINNYSNKERSYEVLKNINEINNCDDVINALKDINNDIDINNKLNKIFNIYNKMNNKEEETNDENNKIKIKKDINENVFNKNLCSDFKIVYDTLEEIKENVPNLNNFDFYKFLSSILLYEFNKYENYDLRELILNKILTKNNLIKNSYQLIGMIIEKNGIKSEPIEFYNNIKNIQKENYPLISLINKTKNDYMDEIIMNIFERKIIKYFELIPILNENDLENNYQIFYEQNENGKVINKTGIIFDKSFSIFLETIKILDNITLQNDESNLLKLYSIVYVKFYLYKFIYFLINNFHELNNSFQNIIKSIDKLSNKQFSKVIKIYILKLIYNFKNKNYKHLMNFEFKTYGIIFFKEFEDLQNKVDAILEHNFLPSQLNDIKRYKEILQAYEKNPNFNLDNGNLKMLLNKYGLDLFLIFILNKVIPYLAIYNYDKSDNYINFCNFSSLIFKNDKYSKELEELLFLFFDSNKYENKIKPLITKGKDIIDKNIFEIILYGFRFCVNSLNLDNDEKKVQNSLLFPSLLSKNCKKSIENSFIPGKEDEEEDSHLVYLDSVQNHFKIYNDNIGCYVCSCGLYYQIGPPGFPCIKRSFVCFCGKKCGGGSNRLKEKGLGPHVMEIRPGHYRIFRDQEHKNKEMNKYRDTDENIPNMILEDYLSQIIEPIRKKMKSDKNIRKLSDISYRLINFIINSHLFYSYCIGNISKEEINKFLMKDSNILTIIENDWNLLKEALKVKNIDSIAIFINMIFKDLIFFFKKCKMTRNLNDIIKFEKQVEELITQNVIKYPEYSKKYKKSEIQLRHDKNIKILITELIPFNLEKFPENDFPLLKYFHYTEYKNIDDLLKKMNNKKLYPLINQFIINNEDTKKLKYLSAFNEFTNYMINYYSFRIPREEARNKSLINEEIIREKEFNIKYKNFIKAWENIKSKAISYKCRNLNKVKEKFSKNDMLINFLNDDQELNNGMYLASAFQNFIEWQNQFLQPILDANLKKGILNQYVNNISKKISVQEAKSEQIIDIEERFKNKENNKNNYIDFNDIIYSFSERNIFDNDGKINYSNYNDFAYDYDKIEVELGKIILPGVHLFKDVDDLNFVTYIGEAFRGKNSDIIIKFYEKYPQIDLSIEEKQNIINYIVCDNKNNIKSRDYKNIYNSFIILLFYLTNQKTEKQEAIINDIIKNIPEKIKLSEDSKYFFSQIGINLALKKFMNLFFFFEHLCFNDLIQNLGPEYKCSISPEIKNRIIEKLLKKNNLNDKITPRNLASAIRRLISRYLVGTMSDIDIEANRDLSFELSRQELWEEKIWKLDELAELIYEKIKEFQLTVGQAFEFYNLIGEEDRNILGVN